MTNIEYHRIDGKWWFTGDLPSGRPVEYGPYDTKAEAEADARGLVRTYRFEDEPGFVTTEPGTKHQG